MAIANKNDLTHIVRTTQQWTSSYDSYECIPEGVLCVEFTPDGHVKAKIGNGHDIFSKLPYIGGADLTNYFTKNETVKCIEDIIKAKRFICIKGILQNKDQLPSHAECGDLYFVISQNQSSSNKYDEYVYSPSNTWENLGSIPIDIDLSEYAKIVYVDEKIDEVNERIDDIEQHGTHTHANKDILDLITAAFTAEEKDKLSTLYNYDDTELRELITQASHTHSNKDILDAISAAFTAEDRVKLDSLTPYDDSILKEKIQALERLAHEHSNKRILDRTTASFTTEYERKMRWIRLYTGCTGMEEGIAGLVPAAQAGEEDYVLSGSGEWVPQTGGGGTYELPIASASTLGGIKVGNGLEIDANGVLSTTGGGGGGDSIAEGDGITITTDPQTGVKTISVNTGDNLEVDPNTGELNVTGVDYTAGKGIFIGNEYQNVEYIKNSGNYDQIILTDIIPSSTDRFEMDIKFGAATGLDNNKPIYGAVGTNQRYDCAIWMNDIHTYTSISTYNHFTWQTERPSNTIDASNTIKYEGNNPRQLLTVTRNTVTWGNVTTDFSDQIDPSYAELNIPIAIFGKNVSNTSLAPFVTFELSVYGVKLYDSNNTLLHNLVPVKKLSNNEGGLYDTVTNKFYGNSGNGSFVTGPAVETDDRIINAKIGNGLDFDSNNAIEVVTGNGLSVNQDNELEVNTGNGLQINQDGELEIDPSIIPEVPNLIPGKAIEFEHESSHLQLTDFSNNDFIASVTSMNNGTFSRPADNSSITISSSSYDCYTKGIGGDGGSSGSYAYTVKPNTQYRLMWDSSDTTISGNTIIFENAGYNRMHSVDQAIASYIDFTTGPNCSFFSTRFGIANPNQTVTFSNIRLYEYVEDTFESDKINVKYNKGLNINRDNELEVVLSDGLQFDLTASETLVADKLYLFNSRVTCQVHTDSPFTGFPSNRTYQKTTIEPALCCLWEVGGADLMWTGPLIVGLTETSVQYTTQDTSQTVNYQNTFTYLGKTWYTSGYPDFLNDADHEDKLDHLQYLGSYSTTADQIQAAKDLIDLANVRFVSNAGIQAKLGNGLSFDANGAIQADAQPLSPATDSTLGGVIVGDGILVDNDGTISVDPTIIPEVIEYEGGTAILVVDNSNPYINKVRWTISDIRGTSDSWIQMRYFGFYNENQERLAIQSGLGEWSDDSTVTYYQHRTLSAMINNQYEMTASLWDGTKSFILTFNLPVGTRLNDLKYFRYQTGDDETHRDPVSWEIHAYSEELDAWLLLNTETNATIPTGRDTWTDYFDLEYVPTETIDAWNSGTGWDNFAYTSGDSDSTSGWNRCVHSPVSSINTLFPVLSTKIKVIARDQNDGLLSVRIELHTSAGRHYGCYEYSQDEEIIDLKEFCELHSVDVPAYVSLGLCTLVNPNYASISPSNVSRVDIIWYTDIVSPTKDINVKYGDGLTVNQNNELEVKLGDGLTIDEDGAIEVTGGGSGGDSIAEGEGITITTDSQTGVKTIGVNVGAGLDIDPITNELFVNGQLPEGTIIKKLTYTGNGEANNIIHFTKKPLGILTLYGLAVNNKISAVPTVIDATCLMSVYGNGSGSDRGGTVVCSMSYNDTTNELTLSQGPDVGARYNVSGETYQMFYLTKGHTGSGTSVNNEVSVIKTITYTGTGTATNNIQFPETPDFILSINGKDGVSGDMVVFSFDNLHPSDAHQYIYTFCYNAGISSNYFAGGHGTFDFNPTTNVLTLTGADQGAACNYLDRVYYLRYVVNEVIPSTMPYAEGDAISIETIGGLQPTNFSNNDFVDSITNINAGTIVKAADNSSFTLTATANDCYTQGSSMQSNGSYPYNVKASTKYRFAWDSADPDKNGIVYVFENGQYGDMMHNVDQHYRSYIEFTTTAQTSYIQARFGVDYAGNSITYSNVRLYEVIEDEDQYNEISVKYGDGLTVNNRNELEVNYGNGLEIVSGSQYRLEYYFNTQVQCQVHTDNPVSGFPSNRTYQKTTTEPALCCIWEVGDSGYLWTGPLLVGTTATSVQYTTQDTSQPVNYQNTFTYLGQTWYTSGYPDFLNSADHEDKLGNLQYLGSYAAVTDQIQAAKDLIDLALIINNVGSLQAKLGSGLSFDANGAIQVTGGGGGSGDTVAEGAGIEITTDQQTGNKVIAVNPGSGLQVNQTTNELEVSSGVVTSIAPTQNTPGSITVTEGDGTTTPVSVISQMGGATSSTAGTAGYVPAPAAGDDDAYLRGDGTWDDSVVTEDDELTLVFVPDDYQPS